MTPSANSQDLARQIEKLVRDHIAISRSVAKAAVERAFAEADRKLRRSTQPGREPQGAKPATRTGRRRTPEELAALGEQFYGLVCKTPGETMMVLADRLGVSCLELKVPVARLKRAGRIRCAGQKSHMQYFPMVGEAKDRKEVTA